MDNRVKKMLLEDKLYDKKSLVFENGDLREISDRFDHDKLPEGRHGEFPLERFKTAMDITLYVPLTNASESIRNAVVFVNSEILFEICTEDRYLHLEKCPENDDSVIIRNNADNLITAENNDGEDRLVGFIETSKGDVVLGCVERLKIKNDSYVFAYGGTGNFTDIKMEMTNIVHFLKIAR